MTNELPIYENEWPHDVRYGSIIPHVIFGKTLLLKTLTT